MRLEAPGAGVFIEFFDHSGQLRVPRAKHCDPCNASTARKLVRPREPGGIRVRDVSHIVRPK